MTSSALPRQTELMPHPSQRCLRVFAFDPQASTALDTAIVNDEVIYLPWEKPWEDSLETGPVNEYLEVIDIDPTSSCFYPPLNLDHPALLAQQGLPPSDGNPQFHQQMVFAVAMKTIRTFERALGRHVFWMREGEPATGETIKGERSELEFPGFVRRLRVYPHAMREANAYYSPQKAALLFGYFRGSPARDGTGGEWVFTCLSQDIIAHETTHAILHGLWRRSVEPSNIDSLAFHEAFADIVALMQHFSAKAVIEHQLTRSGGNLRSVGLLTGLAQQFGRATGREGPLRFALAMVRQEEEALKAGKPLAPDRNAGLVEPHKRGQILVAAIFDAFVSIFERRTEDLFRMSGRRRGDSERIPAELVARLAEEAEKAASQVLRMCIRALDYLPPVDATFGEYLRAIVTADVDLVPNDPLRYRTAFTEAFRKRGIVTDGHRFCSTETLYWEAPEPFAQDKAYVPGTAAISPAADSSFFGVLRDLHLGITYGDFEDSPRALKRRAVRGGKVKDRSKEAVAQSFSGARGYASATGNRNLRDLAMLVVRANQAIMHDWLYAEDPRGSAIDREWEKLLGVRFLKDTALPTIRANSNGEPRFEVQSVRISRRNSPDGDVLPQMIVQVVQSRRGYYDLKEQEQADAGTLPANHPRAKKGDFTFRGGATLIIDLRDGHVQRVIRKKVWDDERLAKTRAFRLGDIAALGFEGRRSEVVEPFAMLHRGT